MKQAVKIKTINNDLPNPSRRYIRLQEAMEILLDRFDDMDVREQVATISAIARIEIALIKIGESGYVTGASGATVKRYEKAFAANAASKRESIAGSAALLSSVDSDDDELEY